MRILKIILLIIIIGVGVDLLYTYIMVNRIILKKYLRSSSKKDSIERGLFYRDSLNVITVGDSLRGYQLDFDIWLDVFSVENQIGISPFHYKTIDTSRIVLNIQPLKLRRNWLISFDGRDKLSFLHTQDYVIHTGDSVLIRFYHNNHTELTEIGQISILTR